LRRSPPTFRVLLLALLAGSSCAAPPEPPAQSPPKAVWRELGSWSGQGSRQLDSFTSDTGALRVIWDTKPEGMDGAFRLTIHSAISGRPLTVAVDERGGGSGTAFVSEDPRVFFAVVESSGLDWTLTLAERVE
jgi:hypothetical protein